MVVAVLPHTDARDFFAACGLPVDADLMGVSRNYFGEYTALNSAPQFAASRTWLRDKGLATYESYLVQHPLELIRVRFDGRRGHPRTLGHRRDRVLGRSGPPGALFGVLGALTFCVMLDIILLWTARRAGVAMWLVVRRRDGRLVLGALIGAAATAVGHAVLAFLGDGLEVGLRDYSGRGSGAWRCGC